MNHLAAMTGINQTVGSFLSQSVAFIEFSKKQLTYIRGDISTIKIGFNLFAKKTFKTRLSMTDCIYKGALASVLFV